MDVGTKIKTLLQEAELYRTQGLLKESIGKYESAAALIEKIGKIKNKENLLAGISKKIAAVRKELDDFEAAPITPEMSEEIQDLIKDKFSFTKDKEGGDLEGVIMLAKFGQYDRALGEFRKLMENDSLRMAAAKNIIRCHMAIETFDDGIAEFQSWQESGQFNPAQVQNLRIFFENLLSKKGIDQKLEAVGEAPLDATIELDEPDLEVASASDEGVGEEELLDVSSIGILMEEGPQKDEIVEFEVSFQSGNEISLLIPSRNKENIVHLTAGTKLEDIEFYSPFAMFTGAGVVTANTKISTGPKRGDFSLDIRITKI